MESSNRRDSSESSNRRDSGQGSGNAGWVMTIYEGPTHDMTTIPSIRGLKKLGTGVLATVVNIQSDSTFQEIVPQTPNDFYVWVIAGTLEIKNKGLCLTGLPAIFLLPIFSLLCV